MVKKILTTINKWWEDEMDANFINILKNIPKTFFKILLGYFSFVYNSAHNSFAKPEYVLFEFEPEGNNEKQAEHNNVPCSDIHKSKTHYKWRENHADMLFFSKWIISPIFTFVVCVLIIPGFFQMCVF